MDQEANQARMENQDLQDQLVTRATKALKASKVNTQLASLAEAVLFQYSEETRLYV